MKTLLSLGCGSVLLCIMGCQETSRGPSKANRPLYDSDSGTLNPRYKIAVADANCQDRSSVKEGVASLGTQTLYQMQGNSVQPMAVDMSSFHSNNSAGGVGLRGNLVQSSQWGYWLTKSAQCDRSEAGDNCQVMEAPKVARNSTELRICSANAAYPRDSLEMAALSTALTIEKSGEFYTSKTGKTLSPVLTLLLPRIETVFKIRDTRSNQNSSEVELDTNNAFWAPVEVTESGKKSTGFVITMLGLTEKFVADNGGAVLGFWEVPFVVSHEFGHHIYFNLAPNFAQKTLEDQNSLTSAWNNSIFSRTQTRAKSRDFKPIDTFPFFNLRHSDTRKVSNDDVLSAFNEAFADLFAEDFTQGSSSNLNILPGNCDNRTVTKATFRYAGQEFPKAIDESFLADFTSPQKMPYPGPDATAEHCSPVFHQDEHALGAAIAHGFHSLMGTRTDRVQILAQWAPRLDALYAQNLPLNTFFANGITEFGKIVGVGNKLSAEQCAAFNYSFPALLETNGYKELCK